MSTHYTNQAVKKQVKLHGYREAKVTVRQGGTEVTKTHKRKLRTRSYKETADLGRRGLGKASKLQRSEYVRDIMPDVFMAHAFALRKEEKRSAAQTAHEERVAQRAERKAMRALRRGQA